MNSPAYGRNWTSSSETGSVVRCQNSDGLEDREALIGEAARANPDIPQLARYTAANIGKRSAIVLDGEILSVPVIEDVIRDSGQIRGSKTLQEAEDLAVKLRSGALPASIELMQERTVEAAGC